MNTTKTLMLALIVRATFQLPFEVVAHKNFTLHMQFVGFNWYAPIIIAIQIIIFAACILIAAVAVPFAERFFKMFAFRDISGTQVLLVEVVLSAAVGFFCLVVAQSGPRSSAEMSMCR